jgi:hypothetical protein
VEVEGAWMSFLVGLFHVTALPNHVKNCFFRMPANLQLDFTPSWIVVSTATAFALVPVASGQCLKLFTKDPLAVFNSNGSLRIPSCFN